MAASRDDGRPPEADRCRRQIATPGDRELTRHGRPLTMINSPLSGPRPWSLLAPRERVDGSDVDQILGGDRGRRRRVDATTLSATYTRTP